MTTINDNTVAVFTYTELKTVLEGNNNKVEYFSYLNNDNLYSTFNLIIFDKAQVIFLRY